MIPFSDTNPERKAIKEIPIADIENIDVQIAGTIDLDGSSLIENNSHILVSLFIAALANFDVHQLIKARGRSGFKLLVDIIADVSNRVSINHH
jgi:hypothetical protein